MKKRVSASAETFAEKEFESEKAQSSKFFLIGNNLSVDFINTEIVENGAAVDLLGTLQELAGWATAVKLLNSREAKKMLATVGAEAADFLRQVKEFRRILRQTVTRLANGETVQPTAIQAINRALLDKSGFVEIAATAEGFEKQFRAASNNPAQLLAAIAESAADLLCYGNLLYLRKCENPNCVLYFYDTTKNHRRRWCSMAGCGNRAKAAAFYRRQREQQRRSA